MQFNFHFNSSHADLLDANRVLNRVGCFRKLLQVVGVGLGLMWLTGAVLDWRHTTPLIFRVVSALAGAGLIGCFILLPYFVRRKILTANEAIVEVHVAYDENGITTRRNNGVFDVGWSEVDRILTSADGVLVVLRRGPAHWLPARVFKSADEKSRFLSFLAHHLRKRRRKQETAPESTGAV